MQSFGTTRRVLPYADLEALLRLRVKRDRRQTPGEWARDHGRASVVFPWSVYDGSMRLWWAHADGNPAREHALLSIARDWWWDKGGALSSLALSEIEWERELSKIIVGELDQLFGGWDGVIWRENGRLVTWREGPSAIIPAGAVPIMGPDEKPPHGCHVRGALGCGCSYCTLALQATRKVKRESGRPRRMK